MSITKVRSMFEKKGCQVLAWIVGALTIVGLMNTGTCTFGGVPGQQGQSAEATTIAEVGGKTVSVKSLEDAVTQARQGQQMISNPGFEFYLYGNSIDRTINQAAVLALAEKRGLKLDAVILKRILDQEFKRVAEAERLQMVQQNVLKANATEKEFVEAFKKKTGGKTPDEFKAERLAALTNDLKDPVKNREISDSIMGLVLAEAYENESGATMEDLKKSFDNFNVQRLAFEDPKQTAEQRDAAAKKAHEEIKGGLRFTEAMKKYAKGRPVEPLPYGRGLLEQQADLKMILDMKPGQTSDVITQAGSPVIYHLVSITPNLPKDFEKNKEQQLKQFRQQRATAAIQKDIDALKASSLKWTDPGVEFAYDVFKAQNEGYQLGPEGMKKRLEELVERSEKVSATTGVGERVLALAKYSAFEAHFQGLTPEKQKQAREQRSIMLQELLDKSESADIRLQLYDNLLASEDYEGAADVLLKAAEFQVGADEATERIASEIRMRVDRAEKDKKISKEVLVAIRKELARWEQDKIDAQKAEKEAAKGDPGIDKELEKLNDPEAVKKAAQGKNSPDKK